MELTGKTFKGSDWGELTGAGSPKTPVEKLSVAAEVFVVHERMETEQPRKAAKVKKWRGRVEKVEDGMLFLKLEAKDAPTPFTIPITKVHRIEPVEVKDGE